MEIVGLKQKVDNDINKLIAKFVGLPVHPLAKALKIEICRIYKIKTFDKFENEKLRRDFRQSIFQEIQVPQLSRRAWSGGKRISSMTELRHYHCCYYCHDWESRLNPKLTGMIWAKPWKGSARCFYCKKGEYHYLEYNNLNGYKTNII
jgi:hypothetical protein